MNIRTKKILFFTIASFIIFSVAAGSKKTTETIEVNGLPISNLEQPLVGNVQVAVESLNNGQWNIANKVFSAMTETSPNIPIGWIGLSKTASSLEQATLALIKAKELSSQSSVAEKYLMTLQQAYLAGNSEKQMNISQKMVSDFPKSPWAWIERGYVLEDHKQIEKARSAYIRAAKVSSHKIGAYLASGASFMFSEPKDMLKAEEYFQKAVNLQPTNAWAQINLGDSHRAQQDLQQAYQDYNRASLLEPNNSIAINKRGHVNSFLGNYEQARKDFDRAVKVSMDVASVFDASGNFKAFTHLYDNKPKQALKLLEQHLVNVDTAPIKDHQKNQAKMKTLANMSKIALHTQILDKAGKYITTREILVNKVLTEIDNKELARRIRSDLHFQRGQLQAREGQLEMALQSADKMRLLLEAVKDERKLENYHELQALISIQKEQWNQAIAHYDKADKDKLYVKYHKAVALEQTGESKMAKKLFTEVSRFNFNSVDFALLRNSATNKAGLNTVASVD